MNRETQAHFAQIPSMDISRSKFDRSFIHKTTCNTGELVPIYVDPDIVPGDTVTMRCSDLIRMTTPIVPVMDELKADFFFFFVPNRLVWSNFKRFMGENDTAPWIQTVDYQIPQIQINNEDQTSTKDRCLATVEKGSILDHMGIPTQYKWKCYQETPTDPTKQETTKRKISISQLPTRAYCMIWNEFFRSEALQNPVNVPTNDTAVSPRNVFSYNASTDKSTWIVQNSYKGCGPCLPVCKTFDYFTACLPRPQAGPDVTLPMNGAAPIKTAEFQKPYDGQLYDYGRDSNDLYTAVGYQNAMKIGDNPVTLDSDSYSITVAEGKLYADLTMATGATINQLRNAFAIQKWQEREARGGQRYTEMVRSHYNVVNPDFRLQRPEYLGGFTHQISMNQVLSQGNDASGAPIGTTGAYSLTTHKDGDVFSHSFTEHGILLGLMCIRQNQHTYQQGINRAWFKKDRVDFYTPEFANLGETYVTEDEIYATGVSSDDKAAFGYQERWAEMRYMPDMVSGEMRSDYPWPLDIWHYADYYDSKPDLGDKWIKETAANVNRSLAVQNQDQFKIDLYFGAIYTRPLPTWSVPGLLDHH